MPSEFTELGIAMLRQRLIVAIIFVPLIFAVVAYGSWVYPAMIAIFMGVAAAEYGQLFRRANLRPALWLLVLGVAGLCLGRGLAGFASGPVLLTTLVMAAMVWHMVDYERGAARSGTDFAVTVSGIVYLGWVGAYLISLRQLPDGAWWVLLALPTVWLSDSAAYFVGQRWGRHHMTPRLSPRKTWEGYLSGVVTGAVSGAALAALWGLGPTSAATLTPVRGLTLGVLLAILAPLGDFGISMFKREMGVKDTSGLVPGHGGALDRTDSWVWAGALAFHIVIFFTN
jgi:phosphatidate cytidylyltransferase